MPRVQCTCAQCGATFVDHDRARGRKYCSRACTGLARRTREDRPCPRCGRAFAVEPNASGKRIYCSMACKGAAHQVALADRFWSRVQKGEGCWLWGGSLKTNGYGQLNGPSQGGGRDGKNLLAHRVAWELVNGPIPDGLWVLHRCDNPPCVNPAHLFLGTVRDNVIDMWTKGRGCSPFRRVHVESFVQRSFFD